MSPVAAVLRRNAVGVLSLLVTIALLLSALSIFVLGGRASSNCHQIESLKAAITLIVAQSVKTLGVKGSAGYDYYHSHPGELAAAKAAGVAELFVFKPKAC